MAYDLQSGGILVIDDNRDIRAFAKRSLEAVGYSVTTAGGGEEGLRFYAEQLSPDHRAKIALLLTDVTMPGMNGFELADRVLTMDSQLPVLFMTGSAWHPYRGFECIAKPFRSAQLIETVNRVLNANTKPERAVPAA
jgi:CheY-like chemotaxis protein